MLILTTNALNTGENVPHWPAWPGLRVLVVLPGSGHDRRAPAVTDDHIVVEWLRTPESTTLLLNDVFSWLQNRLFEDEGPLLYLDTPIMDSDRRRDPDAISSDAVQANFDSANHLIQLVLGEMVATSPLLPETLRILAARNVDDVTMIDLLTEVLVWDESCSI